MARKLSAKKLAAARIQRAVTGFLIPMTSIPKLYARLTHAVESGMSDEYLKAAVAEFPGVQEA